VSDGGTAGGAESQQYTFGTLQNVQVIGVIHTTVAQESSTGLTAKAQKDSAPAVAAYVVALDPQDALLLKYLRDRGATMDLALRNMRDDAEHVTKPVDQNYVVDKYQLQVH
jgi:Flp pilus assembly protein CpaB